MGGSSASLRDWRTLCRFCVAFERASSGVFGIFFHILVIPVSCIASGFGNLFGLREVRMLELFPGWHIWVVLLTPAYCEHDNGVLGLYI